MLIAALALGGVAIWLLRRPWAQALFWPWLVLVLAMFAAARSLQALQLWLPGEPILPHLAAFTAPRRRLAGIACIAAAVASTSWVVFRLWPDYHKWHGTPAFWIAALVLMLVGAWLLGAVGHGAPRAAAASTLWPDSARNRRFEIAAFVLILVLAIFLRTYRLDAIPPGIYVDETNGGLDALYLNEGRDASPFATGWYGTPNGYIYYMAGMFKLFGANWTALKFVSLIPAILTIPAVYFIARLLFGPLAALMAMLFMAVSRWHLSLSRWGWNETAPPLLPGTLHLLPHPRPTRSPRAGLCAQRPLGKSFCIHLPQQPAGRGDAHHLCNLLVHVGPIGPAPWTAPKLVRHPDTRCCRIHCCGAYRRHIYSRSLPLEQPRVRDQHLSGCE